MKTTLKEISEATGVSISTVSRVLKNDSRISEKTKRKVLSVAKKMNYQVDIELESQEKVMMFLVSNPHQSIESDEFFSRVQHGILDSSRKSNFHCLVQSIRENDRFIDDMVPLDLVEGLVVGGIPMSMDLKNFLLGLKIPVVLIGKYKRLEHFPSVNNDNVRGGYIAAQELVRLGYKKITVLTGPTQVSTFGDRLEGFYKGLKEAVFSAESVKVIECRSFEEADGKKTVLKEYKNSPTEKEAIFCTTDWLAKGAMEAFAKLGIKVPDDIGVMGFGGLEFGKYLTPSLSTVALNPYLLGKISMLLLQEAVEGVTESSGTVFVEPRVALGNSLK